MKGKEKCRALKELRQQIAKRNDIEIAVHECTFQGECKGTCPRCEAELSYLEKELDRRKKLGKTVAALGIALGSIGVAGSLTACAPTDFIDEITQTQGDTEATEKPTEDTERLDGEVEIIREEGYVDEPLEGAPTPEEESKKHDREEK